ncbi:MAG: hypothetical protein R3F24_10380 [Gammaproteobacteria bacterium]
MNDLSPFYPRQSLNKVPQWVHRLIPGLALALMVVSGAALAADVPNFSGTWVLNTDKGENLGMVAALKETVKITQTPQQMTLDFSTVFMGKTTQRQVNYDLTGKPVPNEGAMGDKASTVTTWADGKLKAVWTGESAIPGNKTVKTETRALSADGKSMTVTNVRGAKPPMVMVYEKQ